MTGRQQLLDRTRYFLIPVALLLLVGMGSSAAAEEGKDRIVQFRETGFDSGAWKITNKWDRKAEEEFAAFVEAVGTARETRGFTLANGLASPRINPLYSEEDKGLRGLEVDCANLPYLVRAYFAYKTGRPFSFQANKCKRYKEGNKPREFADFSQYPDFPSLAQGVVSAVSSGHFRIRASVEGNDTYPIDINVRSLLPGTVFYDPNGHVLLVYKVDHDKGDISLLDGHPDGTMSRKVFGTSYARGTARFGGGFKAWRHYHVEVTDEEKGSFRISRELNSESAFYSGTAQYELMYWVDGFDMTYHEYVRASVSENGVFVEPEEAFTRMLGGICRDFQDRTGAVEQAVRAGMHDREHPNKLPRNIYGADGDWEKYSSPGRDARLRFKATDLKKFIVRTMNWASNGDRRLKYDGTVSDLSADYFRIWYEHYGSPECIFQYESSAGKKVTLSLEDVFARLWRLSFDPYHCPELRWGAAQTDESGEKSAEFATCPDSRRKLYWYDKERRLRNRITRLLRRATMAHRGPDTPEDIDIPSLLECYQSKDPDFMACHDVEQTISQK